jgi:uncharacterized membrane protein (DUF485 family)
MKKVLIALLAFQILLAIIAFSNFVKGIVRYNTTAEEKIMWGICFCVLTITSTWILITLHNKKE